MEYLSTCKRGSFSALISIGILCECDPDRSPVLGREGVTPRPPPPYPFGRDGRDGIGGALAELKSGGFTNRVEYLRLTRSAVFAFCDADSDLPFRFGLAGGREAAGCWFTVLIGPDICFGPLIGTRFDFLCRREKLLPSLSAMTATQMFEPGSVPKILRKFGNGREKREVQVLRRSAKLPQKFSHRS